MYRVSKLFSSTFFFFNFYVHHILVEDKLKMTLTYFMKGSFHCTVGFQFDQLIFSRLWKMDRTMCLCFIFHTGYRKQKIN